MKVSREAVKLKSKNKGIQKLLNKCSLDDYISLRDIAYNSDIDTVIFFMAYVPFSECYDLLLTYVNFLRPLIKNKILFDLAVKSVKLNAESNLDSDYLSDFSKLLSQEIYRLEIYPTEQDVFRALRKLCWCHQSRIHNSEVLKIVIDLKCKYNDRAKNAALETMQRLLKK